MPDRRYLEEVGEFGFPLPHSHLLSYQYLRYLTSPHLAMVLLKNFSLPGTSQHFMSSLLYGFSYSICTLMLLLPRVWLPALLRDFVCSHGSQGHPHVRDDQSTFPDQKSSEMHNHIQLLDTFTWVLSQFSTCIKLNPRHFPPTMLLFLSSPGQCWR